MRRLRGRPRHNDVLTPREWEVLTLLREGLTNEQIALRLNITFDTAKFHVSEILGKLGVESRQEAAAWRGTPRGVPVPAAAPSVWQRVGLTSPLRVFAATAIATVALGMLALAGGLLLMNSRDGEEPSAVAGVDGSTGDEALDALIDSVLTGDAATLASRFAGVTAREGAVIGGPIGITQAVVVPSDEWTRRLAQSSRELYAVVRDPQEPYPWNQEQAPPSPRASLYGGARDYDVLLVVDESDRPRMPWRMSVLDGQVVDILVDNSGVQGQPGPPPSTRPLLTRLAELMPQPDKQPGSFAWLPPEEEWPPPIQSGASGPPKPAGIAAPAFAPDGRTGQREVDEAINSLLTDDEGELAKRFDGLAGRETRCEPDQSIATTCTSFDGRAPLSKWTRRLAEGKRSLYAVTTGNVSEIDVFIAVDAGGLQVEAWRFGFTGGRVERLTITNPKPQAYVDPALSASHDFRTQLLTAYLPSPAHDYERFLVLPPHDQLPQPPKVQPLTTKTGEARIDALLALLASKDTAGLVAAVADGDRILERKCSRADRYVTASYLQDWATDILPKVIGVDSVVILPPGHQPEADHQIMMVWELNPLLWTATGLFELDGRIVGVLAGQDFSCTPQQMYPPASYVLAPPPNPNEGDPARRSSIAAIDAVLDGAYSGDEAVLADMIVYTPMPCGYDYVPRCPDGVAQGTPQLALQTSGCHGGFALPHERHPLS